MLTYHQLSPMTLIWGQFHKLLQPSITIIIIIMLKINYLKFYSNLPGVNELRFIPEEPFRNTVCKWCPFFWGPQCVRSFYSFDNICVGAYQPEWHNLYITLNFDLSSVWFNSLWPSDTIWRQGCGSTLAQVMACCQIAPSHYLNQCWLITSKAQFHSSEGNFTRDTSATNH